MKILKGFFNRLRVSGSGDTQQRNVDRYGYRSPGHFYSPLPDDADIGRRELPCSTMPDIDLNDSGQETLLNRMAELYPTLPFEDEPRDGLRYGFHNTYFCHADAIYLHGLMRLYSPKRLIEVGSGFSSAAALDTNERFLNGSVALSFIEPNPDRLLKIIRPEDADHCRVLVHKVQDVALEVFGELEANDILFIDSSHVSKVGSDVNHLFFHVLPRLKQGVLIHIHDIFYPFEYPEDWFGDGRAWNEAYLVRAFLMNNRDYRILLFASYVGIRFRALLEEQMPLCLKNTGGSLWLRKEGP